MHVLSGKDHVHSLMNSQFLKTWNDYQKQITMLSETNLKAGVLSHTFVLTGDGIKVLLVHKAWHHHLSYWTFKPRRFWNNPWKKIHNFHVVLKEEACLAALDARKNACKFCM